MLLIREPISLSLLLFHNSPPLSSRILPYYETPHFLLHFPILRELLHHPLPLSWDSPLLLLSLLLLVLHYSPSISYYPSPYFIILPALNSPLTFTFIIPLPHFPTSLSINSITFPPFPLKRWWVVWNKHFYCDFKKSKKERDLEDAFLSPIFFILFYYLNWNFEVHVF